MTLLKLYMMEMIHTRKCSGEKEERYDLFSSLLDASEEESDSQAKLTDRELLGARLFFSLESEVKSDSFSR